MADLDFSHNVPEVPAGASLPPSYQRQVSAETIGNPDIQSAAAKYAEDTNWMSQIGANVAARASNAMAAELGTEQGKTPKGNLGPPLTDFDKAFQDSYTTQAHATLGLQADKLISDSNIEMAKAPRITPGLIAKTNQSITQGLSKIFQYAPDQVKPQLELQYGAQQLSQAEQLTNRMVSEQHEDMKHNNAYSSQVNAENAHALEVAGNSKAADLAVQQVINSNQALVKAGIIGPDIAKVSIDTARRSQLAGRYQLKADQARANGTQDQFLKSLDKRPSDVSDSDYPHVVQSVFEHVNMMDNLDKQDEQIRSAKFDVSIAKDVMGISGEQIEDYRQHVTPLEFARTQVKYFQAVKAFKDKNADSMTIAASWNDPAAMARAKPEAVNKAFDLFTNKYINDMQQKGIPLTHDEAEVQVAASAGGPVEVFNKTIQDKLHSGNPVNMDSAVTQMDMLYSMNKGDLALQKLDEKDKAIYTQYKALRTSLPAPEAAKVAIENSNQDSDQIKMNQERFTSLVDDNTKAAKISPQQFALNQAGLKVSDFINPGTAHVYGNEILNQYKSYYQMLNGDQNSALTMLKQHVSENYGFTGINGGEYVTSHPIEKILGYAENSDVVPFIQQDILNQLGSKFAPLKEAYNKNQVKEYWDIVPSDFKNKATLYGHNYAPVQVVRHIRTGELSEKTEKYNVVVTGSAFDWHIGVDSGSGPRPLYSIAPYLGAITYVPDKKAIDSAYLKSQIQTGNNIFANSSKGTKLGI